MWAWLVEKLRQSLAFVVDLFETPYTGDDF
jgi:hypothetical protein